MQGIMFIEPLTVATAEGRKTRTSRAQPYNVGIHDESRRLMTHNDTYKTGFWGLVEQGDEFIYGEFKPRYKVGEVLYIKEPWAPADGKIIYKYGTSNRPEAKWQNKQGMPAYIARIFIRITGIRVQRLQDITEEEAIREGVMPFGSSSDKWVCYDEARCRRASKMDGYAFCGSARSSFATLWDSLAKPGQKWEDNPSVWVYDYELTTKPE